MEKRIFMIAGPNGAGKTTVALSLEPNLLKIYEFLNADIIAQSLAPLHPETMALTASKIMIRQLRELLEANKNFAFETTASGTNYVKYLKEARNKGYRVTLLFLWLSRPELAIIRVRQRVAHGGHSIPEEAIKRRYYSGIKNLLHYYLPLADSAFIMDNSIAITQRLVAYGNKGRLIIDDPITWKEIEKQAENA